MLSLGWLSVFKGDAGLASSSPCSRSLPPPRSVFSVQSLLQERGPHTLMSQQERDRSGVRLLRASLLAPGH